MIPSIKEGGGTMFKRAYIEITNVCNLRCSFCPGTTRTPHAMTPDEFRTAAQKLRPYTDYLYFHVMGEPLLHPQLAQLLHLADELGFRVCLTTNGTLLNDAARTLQNAPALHKVSISLHSFEGNDGGDMTAYLESVWSFCQTARCIVSLRLWNEGGQNHRNGEIEAFFSQKTGLDVENLPRDPNGNRRLGENLYLETAKKFDWPDLDAEEQNVEFCHGLRQQIAVLCDGTVVPCCLDGNGNIPLGNLFTQDLPDILASPRAKAMVDGFSRRQPTEELCKKCGYARRFNR